MPPDAVRPRGIFTDDHGGWSYTTVLAEAEKPFPVRSDDDETDEVGWVPLPAVAQLDLHPGLAAHWTELSRELSPVAIIVDGANVVGSRPDGWWRDRAGAALRLRDELTPLARDGTTEMPEQLRGLDASDGQGGRVAADPRRPVSERIGRDRAADGLTQMRWLPDVILVVEGAARSAADAATESLVQVEGAPGSGDDTIAALAAQTAGRRIVVTADRELRARCVAAGASVAGPGWLLGQL